MRKVSGRSSLGVLGAVVVGSALAMGGLAVAGAQHMEGHSDEPAVEVAVSGEVRPGNELVVMSPCVDGDIHARFTSSFGVSGELYPAADAPTLIGYLQLPNSLPTPPQNQPLADGAESEHVTITCDSGAHSSVRIDGRNLEGAGSEDLLQELDK